MFIWLTKVSHALMWDDKVHVDSYRQWTALFTIILSIYISLLTLVVTHFCCGCVSIVLPLRLCCSLCIHVVSFKTVPSLENLSDLCSAQGSLSSYTCTLMICRETDAVAQAYDLIQGALHMGKLIAQQIKPLPPQLELNMEKLLI